MQIPKNIEVKLNGKRTAFLSPKADGLKDVIVDIRLNGESTLEFMLPATSEKIEELTPECQIWANGKVYHILKDDAVDFVRDDNNKLWAKFMAVERWYELDTSYVEPSISNDPTARPAADLAVIIVGGGNNLSDGRYATGTAGHALYAILQGSGWTLGTVDIIGIRDLEMEKVSRLQLIKQIQNIWGGYLIWDSINKIVHLRSERLWQNYTGFQVRYRKNLKHITRTQSNKLVTKLYAFGHEDLDIANVNGGKKYITNFNYTSREYVRIYRNPDIHDALELKEKTIDELELISRPRYLYRVKMVDLRTLPEYSHEEFTLGDMVDIIDPSIAPNSPRPRIIRHRYNLFKPWDCELEIGDPEERLIEQLKASFDTTAFINNTFDSSGYMPGSKLVDLSITYKQLGIASVTTQAIANLAVDTEKLGNLAVEASKLADSSVTATKIANLAVGSAAIQQAAIGSAHIAHGVILTAHIGDAQIVSAKIGTAAITSAHIQDLSVTSLKIGNTAITEEKLRNGAITNSKIANLAVTNAKIENVEANKITTNYAKINTAQIERLEVGVNVIMGRNAYISWGNIDGKPRDLAYISDIPDLPSYIKSTYIDETRIESPYIFGGTIRGGRIISDSEINVTTDVHVGRNIYMHTTGGDMGIHFDTFSHDSSITVDSGGGFYFGTTIRAPSIHPYNGASGTFYDANNTRIRVRDGIITEIG